MADQLRQLFVEIPLPGDWPSPEDLNARNAVTDELDRLRIGEFLGAGGGLGNMDFSYRVADADAARRAVEAALARHLPQRAFTIEVSENQPPSRSATEGIPSSRSYIHGKCGEATEVGGGDFKNMATPVPGMSRTMCAACRGFYPVEEFRWADTSEDIVAYYARHRLRVGPVTTLLCSRPVSVAVWLMGVLSGIGLGIWCGLVFGVLWGIVVGILATLIGFVASLLIWDMLSDWLLNRALSVPDVRCLK